MVAMLADWHRVTRLRKMKKPGSSCSHGWAGPPVAVLWDQSLVWGLLCIDTLSILGVPFRLLSASEICADCLDAFRILLVPGGWAAHKVRALGETGRLKVAKFIDEGGSYIGFCGGAGLALSSPPALYLTPIRRMPLSERLPSASGEIYVSGALSHPAWQNIPPEILVSVWWPSQFLLESGSEVCLPGFILCPRGRLSGRGPEGMRRGRKRRVGGTRKSIRHQSRPGSDQGPSGNNRSREGKRQTGPFVCSPGDPRGRLGKPAFF